MISHSQELVGDDTWLASCTILKFLIPEGVLADNAVGMYGTDEVYSDLDVEKFEKLPPDQPHRGVDLEVLEADKQGKGKPFA
jgi:hypothetical protein